MGEISSRTPDYIGGSCLHPRTAVYPPSSPPSLSPNLPSADSPLLLLSFIPEVVRPPMNINQPQHIKVQD